MSNEEDIRTIQDNIRCYGILHHPQGALLIKDLNVKFGTHAPAFTPDKDGHFCTHKAAIRDGQRQVILHIERCLSLATNEQPKKKRKAKTE